MRKKEIFTFKGMNQDVTKSKHPKEFYYEGRNIRVNATDSQSTGSVTNEKGNKLVLSIPTPSVNVTTSKITYGNKELKFAGVNNEITNTYSGKTSGDQIIIGHVEARDAVILFTTDDNGFDCIWELSEDMDLTLLYMRDLGFNKEKPIQSIFNFENEKIQKVYWVDGDSQLRFLNTTQSKANGDSENLIDLPSRAVNIVGDFSMTQPVISKVDRGGTHTAGMIQYAYNLYRVNGSQTKLSPLSELIPLAKSNGGGETNELVGASPVVTFSNIDKNYSNIKIYAIKYTSYNQAPKISLIKDQALNPSSGLLGNYITVRDNGSVISDLSLDEFLFLGSNPISPKHIEAKDSTLFLANIKETNFDVDLDTRAFPHDNTGKSVLATQESYGGLQVQDGFKYPPKFDAINNFPTTQIYQKDGVTLGGEGKHVKYELVPNSYTDLEKIEDLKLFKSSEYYRIGLQFYNRLGQISFPKWIGDFIAPSTNLKDEYHTLKVTLKPEFYVWLNTSSNFESEDDKPVGYKILRADRKLNDRTVLCQGILNSMVSNVRLSDKDFESVEKKWEQGLKLPSLLRPFADGIIPRVSGMQEFRLLSNASDKPNLEFWKDSKEDAKLADTYQFNKLIQMYTPEAMFESVPLKGNLKLRVVGLIENYKTQYWNQIRSAETKEILRVERSSFSDNALTGDKCGDYGIFGPSAVGREVTEMDFFQFYREFRKLKFPTTTKSYTVNAPEFTERGQGSTFYSKHPSLNYANSLTPLITDSSLDGGSPITTVNSYGAPCLTFTIGGASMFNTSTGLTIDYDPFNVNPDNSQNTALNLISLDKLYKELNINSPNSVLLAEFYTDDYDTVYGGRTYEEIKRTEYIEIGKYTKIDVDTVEIESPGDTFINYFTFNKLGKTDTEVYSPTASQITEIVKFPVETTVDLKNRADISSEGWDKRFQPRYDEYHNYNRVYSQEPNLITTRDAEYTFKKVENFDTKIVASKNKIPGEVIDSWTDLLINEEMFVDGKYGPINGLVNYRDELFSFQNKGFSHIAINPRVQVQGSDGVAVELGSGRLLHDYKYFSTNSGSINKWGIIASEYGIYFVDAINKTLNRFSGKLDKLSDTRGLHTWAVNNIDYDLISNDNPILNKGVTLGYDPVNHSILYTFLQDGVNETLLFDEATNGFVSFMDYQPSRYINLNDKLFSPDSSNKQLYEHFAGDYNNFYGESKPSYITLMVNPATNYECVFDNIEYNGEISLNDIDQPEKTLTHIQAWNEYQDSGKIPLELGRSKNLRRKFRTWRANIPREGRSRMRNPWIYLKLELDNTNNYKLILHDIIVNYTVN